MNQVVNQLVKMSILIAAIFLAVFVLTAKAETITGVSTKPEYKFDFNAPRVKTNITNEICVQVGYAANGVSQSFVKGETDKEITQRLYYAARKNLDDADGVAAATMVASILQSMRSWNTAEDYIKISEKYPELDRHSWMQILGEARCKQVVGQTISVAKVVEVPKTLKQGK